MNKKGFTLIEMVVVLAVVAILAAILTPTISKSINDSKNARATNETQVIAAAIASFYKDLGRWPTSNGTTGNPDYIYLLYSSQGDVPSRNTSVTNSQYWLSNQGWAADRKDTFLNHLIENDPRDASVDYNSTNRDFKWNGPYISEIKPDPWGSQYSCNIVYTFYNGGNQNAVGIFSAGKNRTSDTQVNQPISTFQVGEDDIIQRIQ